MFSATNTPSKPRDRFAFALGAALLICSLLGCSSSDSPAAAGGSTAAAGSAGSGNPASGTAGSDSGGSGGTGPGSGGAGGSPVSEGGASGSASGGAFAGSGGSAGLGGSGDQPTAGSAGMGGAAGAGTGGTATGGRAGAGGASAMLKAVMVVQASGTPTAGDKVMQGRLTARGIQTTFFSDAAVTVMAVTGMDLVVISSSAESASLAKKLRDIAIPVLCIENGEYPLMAMTGPTLNTDFGQLAGQTQVQITAAGNPLVGTLSGTVTISGKVGDFGWGIPGPAALRGATVAGNPNRFAIFGYDTGAQMVGMVAPAKRAAFAIRETLAANLSSDGSKLFDALLNWVLS